MRRQPITKSVDCHRPNQTVSYVRGNITTSNTCVTPCTSCFHILGKYQTLNNTSNITLLLLGELLLIYYYKKLLKIT